MRILVEVTQEKEADLLDGESKYEKNEYFLWHFGLEYSMVDVGDGRVIPANYTVCICERCTTGQLETFLPSQLKIIGKELK